MNSSEIPGRLVRFFTGFARAHPGLDSCVVRNHIAVVRQAKNGCDQSTATDKIGGTARRDA